MYLNNQQVNSNPDSIMMNLKGYMVGNGATNWDYDVWPSYPQTVRWFNIIPPSLLTEYENAECFQYYFFYDQYTTKTPTAQCQALSAQIMNLTSGLNWYDVYRPVYDSGIVAKQDDLRANRYGTTIIDGEERTYKKGWTMQEYTPWVKHIMMEENPIILGDFLSDYMN